MIVSHADGTIREYRRRSQSSFDGSGAEADVVMACSVYFIPAHYPLFDEERGSGLVTNLRGSCMCNVLGLAVASLSR